MDINEFLLKNYPDKLEEFKRANTLNYYEAGKKYKFNKAHGRTVILNDCELHEDMLALSLTDINDGSKYSVDIEEAFSTLTKVDDDGIYNFNMPVKNGSRYFEVNGIRYSIHIMRWHGYNSKKLESKVWIRNLTNPWTKKMYGRDYTAYFELYSLLGDGKWNYKHVHSYDDLAREQYDIKFNVSVRKAKELIFGDANVKIPKLPYPSIYKNFDKHFTVS